MRTIKEGDTVDVFWDTTVELKNVKVMHTPIDVGDLWYFEDNQGNEWAINPHCSTFQYIVKKAPKH